MKVHGNEKRYPPLYLFSKTWRYSEGNRSKVIWYWIMFILANSIHVFGEPLLLAHIVNVVQKEGVTKTNIHMLLVFLSMLLVIDFIFWSLHGPARCLERNNAFEVELNYRSHLLKGVMMLPMEWHADHHSGDTIDKVEKGTTALFEFAEDSFEVIYLVAKLIISYFVLVYFSPPAAYIVLGMIIISVWITVRFDRVLIEQYKELNHADNSITESTFDAISNIATVIILRVERLVFQAILHKMRKPRNLFRRNQRLSEIKWFLTSICSKLMQVIVLGVYFWQSIGSTQGVLIGSVYLLLNYTKEIGSLFSQFNNLYGDIIRRKTRTMNSEELAKDFKPANFTNHVLPEEWQRLEIEGLNFSYHNGDESALHLENVCATFERGKRYAIVGESGGGKSTLLKIMRDLYHPRSITLTVDGQRVNDGFAGISRAISLVPQNPEIFATTIWENITLGAEYDLEFVKHFTDMACFTDVVEALPKKFDSSIKEKGVNLSGGQQQRLALARGLLACYDKDIVLLDEPTSSLDTATEMKVYRNIFREFRDKTVISSVHRLHLLLLFHEIYMFSGGRIIASGTLQDLLTQCPEFQELWREYHQQKEEV